jgi:hypothetical protein
MQVFLGAASMERIAPPDPQAVPALFEGLHTPAARIERLVREASALYERGAPQLRAMREEVAFHPNVAEADQDIEASLSALVHAALKPSPMTSADRAVARAMIDLGTWQALRDQGIGPADAVAAVSGMLAARVVDAAR